MENIHLLFKQNLNTTENKKVVCLNLSIAVNLYEFLTNTK